MSFSGDKTIRRNGMRSMAASSCGYAPCPLNLRQTSFHLATFIRILQAADLLGGNDILTLNEAADVLARRDVLESDIDRHLAKQRDTGADQHWNASDDEPMNEPSSKKSLNGDPAIYVNVPNPAGGKPRHDFRWCPRHVLHDGPGRSRSQRVTA